MQFVVVFSKVRGAPLGLQGAPVRMAIQDGQAWMVSQAGRELRALMGNRELTDNQGPEVKLGRKVNRENRESKVNKGHPVLQEDLVSNIYFFYIL